MPEMGVPFVSSVTVKVVDSPGFSVRVAGLIETCTVPPATEASLRGSTELLERIKAMITPILMIKIPPSVIMMALGDRSEVASVFGTVALYSAVTVLTKSSVILSAFLVVARLLVASSVVCAKTWLVKMIGFKPAIESRLTKLLPLGLSVISAKSA